MNKASNSFAFSLPPMLPVAPTSVKQSRTSVMFKTTSFLTTSPQVSGVCAKSRRPRAVFMVADVDTSSSSIKEPTSIDVRSVNYFISRLCNYNCQFCFHTAKNADMLPLSEAKRGLTLLKDAGTQKVNFAGGEPFLHAEVLGELCQHSFDLGLAVSIISNGSLITKEWMAQYGGYVDLLGVSADSFVPETNLAIGRGGDADKAHINHVMTVRELCSRYDVRFKLNTVVCSLNWEEDMHGVIRRLDPFRWKVFQCLILGGENAGLPGDLRSATHLTVTDDQFTAFVDRHRDIGQMIPEPNNIMRNSYLLLDEKMRFLDCSNGLKVPGASILDVGVGQAIEQSGFDKAAFESRGGVYTWKDENKRH